MRDFGKNTGGQILVLTAVAMPVLIGITALALDVGFMFDYRRRAQAAADAAAMSAGLQMNTNPGLSNGELQAVARQDARFNGFEDGVNDITVTLHRPPISGFYTGNNTHIQVVIERPTPMFMMRVLGRNTMMVGATAVAGLGSHNGCIYALRNESGTKSFDLPNTKLVNAHNCQAYGNGKFFVDGTLNIDTVTATGAREGVGTVNAAAGSRYNTGVFVADPLAALPWPTECTSWGGDLLLSGTQTFNLPVSGFGCYNKIEVAPNSNITFGPGRYHANNGVFLKGPSVTNGAGVTFFSYNDKIEMVGNVTLRAPSSGTYAGILFFVRRDADKEIVIANTAVVNLNGTLYSQIGKIQFSGITQGTIDYSIFVAGYVLFADSGTVNMNADLSSLTGGGPIKRVKVKD